MGGTDRIQRIKGKYSVISYARSVLNIPVRKTGDRWKSFGGGANPTCVAFYEDWWYDFKLCVGGDVIDLCAVARHNGDKGAAIRELGGDDPGWREYTQRLGDMCFKWHESLEERHRLYLYRRGIRKETVDRLKIGFDGSRLVIPYWKNGYIAYYVSRVLSQDVKKQGEIITDTPEIITPDDNNSSSDSKKPVPKYKKAPLDGMNENIPWGLNTLDRDSSVLVITEGAFDALSFEQEGYKVLSPMGGHFNKESLKQVLDICKSQETVFLCFDSDDAGNRFQSNMSQMLFRHHVSFRCGTLPEGVKDVSEYYAEAGDLRELVASAEDGVTVMCRRLTDRQEFKTFIFQAARYVGKAELVELFDLVSFPKSWLDQVKKQALSPPPEDLIVREIKDKHRLKFFDALGFYEYDQGVWKRRGDSEIKGYISEALGTYRSGGRVSSIFVLLKAETVSTERFNAQSVFNFRNCVLDLETGEQKEHSETFMSSVQVPYDYIPDAYAPRWASFVEDVCLGDERRIALLQEIAGYVLFSDNSLQKCFFLIGDGANGKSVFLDILADLFGLENVSNVEMSGLVEPFQRIHLLTSIVNISTETRTDVKGAESIFKQIVVGDMINGCYKNKDFFTFRPRTKLIIAGNEFIQSRDTTTGFLRRMCFVGFNAKFTDSPKLEHGEKKADKGLTDKLREELPGIFNWAYQGYKVLREAKEFTVTGDQSELMDSFMRTTNPLMGFMEETELSGRIPRSELYKMYKDWCHDAGHEPMSRTKFIQRFKQTIKQVGIEVSETMSSGERQFIFPQIAWST
nr:phage/plasmid primase, P4 family [uncultured Dethiosulfovibrio sp.]